MVVASGAEVREPTSEITIGDHGTLVEVRQTVSVSNGCKEVGLVGVNYDPESRTLGITTESVNPHLDDPVPCTMAVEPHTYEATVTMQRGTVDAVLVGHEGSDLATETR